MNLLKTVTCSISLVAFGVILFTAPVQAEELDDGIFKWMYSKEIKRIYMKSVALKDLVKTPQAYENLYVKLRVRFNRIETGLTVPEYTPFDTKEHLNFSVWDAQAPLWEEDEVRNDFPFMFVDKSTEAAQELVRLSRFDIIEVYGRVVSLFRDKPWFEVTRVWLRSESELSNTLFAHIRLAEDMFAKGAYDLTVGEIDRILSYNLSGELSGMLLKRKGQALLHLQKYAEAELAFNRSTGFRSQDADVYRGWGLALEGDGMYETALWAFERSLVYKAKQPDIYAHKGYCRAKIADAMIRELVPVQTSDDEEVEPRYIRRRDKQIRPEYDPGREDKAALLRNRLTLQSFEEIIETYEMAILDCRKALFIDPVHADAAKWKADIETRLQNFKKRSETPAQTPPTGPGTEKPDNKNDKDRGKTPPPPPK